MDSNDIYSPINSRIAGTADNDLIQPCNITTHLPATPPDSPKIPAIALALSGGGFRATLAGLGVLRFIADAGLMPQVRYSSSVSGGSIVNGLFAKVWPQLAQSGFGGDEFDDLVIKVLMEHIIRESLKWKLLRNFWRTIGPKTRTEVLGDIFDDWFFQGHRLEDLTPECRFIFNTANLTTGVRFGFERDVMGDYVLGNISTEGLNFRLAKAVAASAAVPGAFAPLELKDLPFPCAQGRIPMLVDGGAYDNSGLEPVNQFGPEVCLVALNAGGLFVTGNSGWIPIIKDLKRTSSILYRQSTALRRRTMVERFQEYEKSREDPPEWGRRGVLFGLATSINAPEEWLSGRPEVPAFLTSNPSLVQWRVGLALTATSFDKFETDLCQQLIYRGWWLTGATMATYHRDILPANLPVWRPL